MSILCVCLCVDVLVSWEGEGELVCVSLSVDNLLSDFNTFLYKFFITPSYPSKRLGV